MTTKPITVDYSRDKYLTDFGKATLDDRYLLPEEKYQDLFARVASYYGDDEAHASRIYDYISKMWFMPATPILSNGGTTRGLPISCFLNETEDSLQGIVDLWNENVWLASRGGGIGSYWGNLRALGEKVGRNGKTSGVIPFIRVQDSLTLAISQGSLRRGSSACYLDICHPEIEEFIDILPVVDRVSLRILLVDAHVIAKEAMKSEVTKPALVAHLSQLPLPVRAQPLVGPARAHAKIVHPIGGAFHPRALRLNDARGRNLGAKTRGDHGDDAKQQTGDWSHWGKARKRSTLSARRR